MAIEQQPGDNTAEPASLSPQGASRRRFTRAGVASGVLLTLQSQSALAGGTGTACAAPSGFFSAATRASRGITTAICSGRTPGYWKTHPSEWPKSGCSKSGPYCAIYLYTGAIDQGYSTTTQMNMLTPQSFDKDMLGAHMMAAYLNALSGKSPYPTTAMLNKIWVEWRDFGYYTVTAGVKWNAAQIVSYLKSTMPL